MAVTIPKTALRIRELEGTTGTDSIKKRIFVEKKIQIYGR